MQPSPDPTSSAPVLPEIITVSGMSNADFLSQYAAPGRVGLSGGSTLIDRAIQRAQRHLDEQKRWGRWSHAFIFQGQRVDGHHWVIESDLQIIRKHVSLGAQENRVTKYHDENYYDSLAVLDFGLETAKKDALLKSALDLIAGRTRYSVRELLGTLYALRHPELRTEENRLSRENSLYCSAFVEHLFRQVGVELRPGVNEKNVTPEDICHSPVAHRMWVLDRQAPERKQAGVVTRAGRRIQARVRLMRSKLT